MQTYFFSWRLSPHKRETIQYTAGKEVRWKDIQYHMKWLKVKYHPSLHATTLFQNNLNLRIKKRPILSRLERMQRYTSGFCFDKSGPDVQHTATRTSAPTLTSSVVRLRFWSFLGQCNTTSFICSVLYAYKQICSRTKIDSSFSFLFN